ncbi:MAG: hypothetical protein OEM64_11030 [Gammaproteobacteria bacterium]|nr:hypothetical protein [Gammaproteobacteria bacterium]MDH3467113.1 hypothetical protein [Gammaproteobacteria bacterium]
MLARFLYIAFLTTLIGSSAYARSHDPCGPDGSECDCADYEWQYSYQDYYRIDLKVVNSGRISPNCETREECFERYNDFVKQETKSAEFSRKSAEGSLRNAKSYQAQGDQYWYDKAMGNYRVEMKNAEVDNLRVTSAVPPHCDPDKERERMLEEFPPNEPKNSDDWVIQPPKGLEGSAGAGFDHPIQLSKRSQQALAEMQENVEREKAILGVVAASPFMLLISQMNTPQEGLVNLAGFDWDVWEGLLKGLSKRSVSAHHNRLICFTELGHLSRKGPSRTEQENQERKFWWRVCQSM